MYQVTSCFYYYTISHAHMCELWKQPEVIWHIISIFMNQLVVHEVDIYMILTRHQEKYGERKYHC